MGLYHTCEHTHHGYPRKLYLPILSHEEGTKNPDAHATKKGTALSSQSPEGDGTSRAGC